MKILKDQKCSTTTFSFLNRFVALRTEENDVISEVVCMINETRTRIIYTWIQERKTVRILNFTNLFKEGVFLLSDILLKMRYS